MVANRQRGLQRIATDIQGQGQQAGAGTFEQAFVDGGEAKMFETAASVFKGVSTKIGALADHAASVEGAQEGRLAGLDPEFRTRRDLTIRGEAFDRAGLDVFKAQTRQSIDAELEALAQKHGDDATGLKKSIADLRTKYMVQAAQNTPEMRADLELQFNGRETAYMRQISRRVMARRVEEQKVAIAGEVEDALKGMHQRAFALGLDGTAGAILADETARLRRLLSRDGADGKPMFSPSTIAKLMTQAKEAVSDAQLLGAFERLPTTAAQAKFIAKLEEDFGASKGLAKDYDLAGFQRIRGRLSASMRVRQAEDRQAEAGVREELKTLRRLAEKGHAPNAEQIAGLKARIATGAASPELTQGLARLEDLASFQTALRASSPGEIEAYIQSQKRAMASGGAVSEHGVDRMELAEKFLTEMRKELKTDPLGWADRTGYSRLVKIEFADPSLEGEAKQAAEAKMAATFKARLTQAEEVAQHYGQAPQYLTADERQRFAMMASRGGGVMMNMAGLISELGGERAPKILAEIFKEAPVVAIVGGLVARAGPTVATRDAADGVALMRTEGFKAVAPPAAKARSLAVSVHGGVLSGFPQSEQALITATNAAYEVRARRQGVQAFNGSLWQRTFREMLGERTDADGEVYGGIVYSRPGRLYGGSGAVVIPPDVKQEQFVPLLRSIRLSDFGDEVPRYGNGKPVSLADFQKAELVQFGDGRYHLNLGDETAPQWLMGANGQPFVLDLEKMEPVLRERMPEAYLGGAPRAAGPDGAEGAGGPQEGQPWYRKPGYRPTEFMMDAAAKFVVQPMVDAYNGISMAAGFQDDRDAPPGFVGKDKLDRAAHGLAAVAPVGGLVAGAPEASLAANVATRRLKTWTGAEVKQVDRMLREGLSDHQIASELGVTKPQLRNIINRYAPEAKAARKERRRELMATEAPQPLAEIRAVQAQRRERIAELFNSGRSSQEIANEVGLTVRGVNINLRKMDLVRPVKTLDGAAERQFVVDNWAKGPTQIARDLGVSKSLVQSLVQRMRRDGVALPQLDRNHFVSRSNANAGESALAAISQQAIESELPKWVKGAKSDEDRVRAIRLGVLDKFDVELSQEEALVILDAPELASDIIENAENAGGDAAPTIGPGGAFGAQGPRAGDDNPLKPFAITVPPKAANDDRPPAAQSGMISGTAEQLPALAERGKAMQAIRDYEMGRTSSVTGADYQRMMPLMRRVFESDGMDTEALSGLEAIFAEIEGRK